MARSHRRQTLSLFVLPILTVGWLLPTATPAQSMMGGLRQTLQELLPYIADPEAFSAEKNKAKVNELLLRLNRLAAHTKKEGEDSPDFGPVADVLGQLTGAASQSFVQGRSVDARFTARRAVEVCVNCHQRLPGNQLPSMSSQLIPDSVNTVERGLFMYALREFQVAIPLLIQAVEGFPGNNVSPHDLHIALDHIITHCVRVGGSPKRALSLLKRFQRRGNLPPPTRNTVSSWMKSLEAWLSEPRPSSPKSGPKSGPTSVADAIEGARSHLGPIIKRVEAGERVEGSRWFIPILRATSLLHRALAQAPQSPEAPEAAYLLGLSYLSLGGTHSFSGLETGYLKACIARSPGSGLAKRCYSVLANATYNGWLGDGGARVSNAVRKDLEAWKRRAQSPPSP